MEKIEITSIQLKIGKKEISLTPEEAKLLAYKLNELLGQGNTDKIWSFPYNPIITYPQWSYETTSGPTVIGYLSTSNG